jgi:outer membrane protein OmpA-like peptidoglycan-associated protein
MNCRLFQIIAIAVLMSSCAAPLASTGKGVEVQSQDGQKGSTDKSTAERGGTVDTPKLASNVNASEYIDLQERELQQSFAMQKNPTVQRSGNILVITFGSDALFGVNSHVLKPGAYDHLSRLAAVLKKYPKTRVSVNGYTDSIGSETRNLVLSEKRAAAVKHAFENDGIPASRVATGGFGETQFVASNATETGRQRNRRLTVVITPDGE